MSRPRTQFAHLQGLDQERVALGWTPRDARQRLSKPIDWSLDPWLRVHGQISCADGDWAFHDPAMTEHEARELADFLSLRPWSMPRTFTCIEPCLAFAAKGESRGVLALAIQFRGECAPPWLCGTDAVWSSGYVLELQVAQQVLESFVRDIRAMLGITNHMPGGG